MKTITVYIGKYAVLQSEWYVAHKEKFYSIYQNIKFKKNNVWPDVVPYSDLRVRQP